MATAIEAMAIEQIGQTAGLIWRELKDEGPLSPAQLVKRIDAPRDLVMQAIGWLAREDKLAIDDNGRSRLIALRETP